MRKKDGMKTISIDYRHFNKASPKENFHFPNIDILDND